MITATWKAGFNFFSNADAQKVAEEIMEIGSDVKPEQIVERAKDEDSELHKCFEWDDTIAAEKYRIVQARRVVRFLVIKEESKPVDRPEVRYFVKSDKSHESGYKPTQMVVKVDTEYEKLLAQAYAELQAFKKKYHMLEELREIFELID